LLIKSVFRYGRPLIFGKYAVGRKKGTDFIFAVTLTDVDQFQ